MAEWTKSCQTYVGSRSTPSWQDFQNGGDRTLSAPVQSCGGLRSAFLHGSHGTNVALSPSHSPVFIPTQTEKRFYWFYDGFSYGRGFCCSFFVPRPFTCVYSITGIKRFYWFYDGFSDGRGFYCSIKNCRCPS